MKSRAITLGDALILKVGPDEVKAVPLERLDRQQGWPWYKVVVTLDNDREAAHRVESKVAKRGGYVTPGMFQETYAARMTRKTQAGQAERAFNGIDTPYGDLGVYVASLVESGHARSARLNLEALTALAARVCELSDIVEQSALTADDLPQTGWGIPEDDDARIARLAIEAGDSDEDDPVE